MVDSAGSSPTWRRFAPGALAIVAASAALVLIWREPHHPARPVSHVPDGAPVRSTPAPPPAPVVGPRPAPLVGPRFEVVRVAVDGSAVIAGRAAPGEQVSVRESGREIGRGRADAQGTFVIVTAAPLPPGTGELTLSAWLQGQPEQVGAGTVVVAVPARENGAAEPGNAETPLAVLVGPEAPRVLQAPGLAKPGHLGLQSIEYDPHDGTRLAGTAPPGAPVRLYVDNSPVGDAVTEIDGLWVLQLANAPPPGRHRLRLDQLGANGRVVARIVLAFQQDDMRAHDISPGRVVVEPGAGLWRITRARRGPEVQRLVVFRASRRQNRPPDRIYPGQVLSVSTPENPQADSAGALEPPR